MDDFDDTYKQAIEAGQRNLKATKLLNNWCFHAEIIRSPGRGVVEEFTGLPIGHMGVHCKFSKKNSMHCWLLEDATYDFYLNNCKGCQKRVHVRFPNIMDFVEPREKAAEERKREREEQERERKQKQTERRQERAQLRLELSLEETFVLNLLDELDQEDIATDDPRLEQLANLAPETFTRQVIKHLLPAVLCEHLPYSIHAARALLRAPLELEEKLSVAVYLVSSHRKSPMAIDVVLSHMDKLSQSDVKKVLHHFVSMALGPPPGIPSLGSESIKLDTVPIRTLYKEKSSEICAEVGALLNETNPGCIEAAVKVILALNSDELLLSNTISIFTKLMRRRILLPKERRNSNVLYYLREVAAKCLERFPEETDKVIQSYLADNDDTGRKEAYRTYGSILKQYKYGKKVKVGTAHRIAFRRLLWAAVDRPGDIMDDAGQFLKYPRNELAQLAVENFDDLIGAAATLSEKYEQIDAETIFELTDSILTEMEKSNKRSSINSLQEALIDWAVIGARAKGREGIEEFLSLYRRLPEDQTQMRGNMIAHVSKLLTGVESLTLVLSDWYSALMDKNTLVRFGAVKAWADVPYELVKNFPDLFFEAFSILLMDPFVAVHKAAVHSLRRRSFPKEKRSLIRQGLWKLIACYIQENKSNNFVVDCIDAYASLCLSSEEKKGGLGQVLSGILLSLEGDALYHAVNQLHYGFRNVPGFAKVALKSIQNDYTRSVSTDDCESAILRASRDELQNCADDIKKAFEALKPFRPEDLSEALLYATVLTKAGNHAAGSSCFKELMASIPVEDRNEQWRLEIALVTVASEIEHAIGDGEEFVELLNKWNILLSKLEKENDKQSKLRDFPPSVFFEN